MAFVIFVGGLITYDSGKTTFSEDIISFFEKELSQSIAPFKPLSGNNLYYHYSELRNNIELYHDAVSSDIVRLLTESSCENLSPILSNPVHRVSTPALPFRFLEERSINTYYDRFSESITLVQRFTCIENENIKNVYIKIV